MNERQTACWIPTHSNSRDNEGQTFCVTSFAIRYQVDFAEALLFILIRHITRCNDKILYSSGEIRFHPSRSSHGRLALQLNVASPPV